MHQDIVHTVPMLALRVLPCKLMNPLLLKHGVHYTQTVLSTPGQQGLPVVIEMTHIMKAMHTTQQLSLTPHSPVEH